jgi:hypothetical protein
MTQENKKRFKKGYYVTIGKHESDFTPCMFWVNINNKVCYFSPENGEIEIHRKTPDEIIEHFEECEKKDFQVIVSGY